MCTCENSEACPKFTSTREPLGDVRLDIMNRLRDAPVVDLKESNDPPREKRLEVTSSRFSYGAHFMPKMTHSTNHDVNCNLFNKMWMNNPAKIDEYIISNNIVNKIRKRDTIDQILENEIDFL